MRKYLLAMLSLAFSIGQIQAQIVANDDNYVIQEDQTSTFDVQLNDISNNPLCQGRLGVFIIQSTENAQVSTVSGTKVLYQPKPNYSGLDSFSYEVTSCILGSTFRSQAKVKITIFPKNDPPTATDDQVSLFEDGSITIDVQQNDFDTDNSTLTTIPFSEGAQNGSGFIVNSDSIFYQPNEDYFGLDSFQYVVCDNAFGSSQALCDTAVVYLNIIGVDDPIFFEPNTITDSILEDERWCYRIDTLLVDVDNEPDKITYSSELNGIEFEVTDSFVNACYMGPQNWNGDLDFEIVACDANTNCATLEVKLTVIPVYDPAIFIEDSINVTVEEDSEICLAIDDLVHNPDSLTLEWTFSSYQLSLGSDSICYLPEPNINGADTASLSFCDGTTCDTMIIVFEVTPIIDSLIAIDDTYTITEMEPIRLDILANDINPDGEEWNLTLLEGSESVSILGDTAYYQPQFDTKKDSFSYTISNQISKDTAWVYLDYPEVFQVFELVDDTISLIAEEIVDADFLLNDTIPNSPFIARFLDDVDWVEGSPKSAILAPMEPGTYLLEYEVCLVEKSVCDTATVEVTITPNQEETPLPEFPNSMSPNGDGINDFFEVKNIELLSNTHLIIYNRWGDKLFEASPYTDEFIGLNQSGQAINDGVYYYTFDYTIDAEKKRIQKYLVIKR